MSSDTDPWARFRYTPPPPGTSDEEEYLGETDERWTIAAWWVYSVFCGAMVLCGLGDGDPRQWRWILGPMALAVGVFTLVRPQAVFEYDNPPWWFRHGRREPSRLSLRWNRLSGVVLVAAGLAAVTSPLWL